MLTLAVPTGRIFDEAAELLNRAGIGVPDGALRDRKLHFEADGRGFVLAKDRDVPTYVEHGVADAGIVGKDVLSEYAPRIYRPLDLGIGRCRMVIAKRERAPSYRDHSVVRVATKYPSVTTRYFHEKGMPLQVIPLAGAVELAPVLGLADCIVDLVQTGKTLEANGLVVEEELFESTAYFVVNRASLRLKAEELRDLIDRLEKEAVA